MKFRSSHKTPNNHQTRKVSHFTPGKPNHVQRSHPKKLFFEYKPRKKATPTLKIQPKLDSKSPNEGKIYSERVPRINVFEIDQREQRGYRAKKFEQRRGSKLSKKFEKDFQVGGVDQGKGVAQEEENDDDMYGMTNEELEQQWLDKKKLKKGKKGVWDKFSNRFLSWF